MSRTIVYVNEKPKSSKPKVSPKGQKIMEEKIVGCCLGGVVEVRRISLKEGKKLAEDIATPVTPKLYGMPKYEVENAVRVLEEAALLKVSKDTVQKKIYEAAMKVIADKKRIQI